MGANDRITKNDVYTPSPSIYQPVSVQALKDGVMDSSFDIKIIDRINTDNDAELSPDELRAANCDDRVALYNALVSSDGKTWSAQSPLAVEIDKYIPFSHFIDRHNMIEAPEPAKAKPNSGLVARSARFQ